MDDRSSHICQLTVQERVLPGQIAARVAGLAAHLFAPPGVGVLPAATIVAEVADLGSATRTPSPTATPQPLRWCSRKPETTPLTGIPPNGQLSATIHRIVGTLAWSHEPAIASWHRALKRRLSNMVYRTLHDAQPIRSAGLEEAA